MGDILVLLTSLTLPKAAFTIKEIDPANHSIFFKDIVHYRTAKSLLETNKVKFYTYTPRSEKPKSVMIKGIKGNFTAEVVKAEIVEKTLGDNAKIEVSTYHFDKKNPHKYHFLL